MLRGGWSFEGFTQKVLLCRGLLGSLVWGLGVCKGFAMQAQFPSTNTTLVQNPFTQLLLPTLSKKPGTWLVGIWTLNGGNVGDYMSYSTPSIPLSNPYSSPIIPLFNPR